MTADDEDPFEPPRADTPFAQRPTEEEIDEWLRARPPEATEAGLQRVLSGVADQRRALLRPGPNASGVALVVDWQYIAHDACHRLNDLAAWIARKDLARVIGA